MRQVYHPQGKASQSPFRTCIRVPELADYSHTSVLLHIFNTVPCQNDADDYHHRQSLPIKTYMVGHGSMTLSPIMSSTASPAIPKFVASSAASWTSAYPVKTTSALTPTAIIPSCSTSYRSMASLTVALSTWLMEMKERLTRK